MTVFGLITAAGSGTRTGANEPKQLLQLAGRTLIEHCVGAMAASAAVDAVLVVVREDQVSPVQDLLAESAIVAGVIGGGATRHQSVGAGLDALTGRVDDVVLVHDGARPLITPSQIGEIVKALGHAEAATLAVPVSDTILTVEDGAVVAVPDRSVIYRAQTPQGSRLGILRQAFRSAADSDPASLTDECSVIARYRPDVEIVVVPGSERNMKITTGADLAVAAALFAAGSEEPQAG